MQSRSVLANACAHVTQPPTINVLVFPQNSLVPFPVNLHLCRSKVISVPFFFFHLHWRGGVCQMGERAPEEEEALLSVLELHINGTTGWSLCLAAFTLPCF